MGGIWYALPCVTSQAKGSGDVDARRPITAGVTFYNPYGNGYKAVKMVANALDGNHARVVRNFINPVK